MEFDVRKKNVENLCVELSSMKDQLSYQLPLCEEKSEDIIEVHEFMKSENQNLKKHISCLLLLYIHILKINKYFQTILCLIII